MTGNREYRITSHKYVEGHGGIENRKEEGKVVWER